MPTPGLVIYATDLHFYKQKVNHTKHKLINLTIHEKLNSPLESYSIYYISEWWFFVSQIQKIRDGGGGGGADTHGQTRTMTHQQIHRQSNKMKDECNKTYLHNLIHLGISLS